MGNNAQTQNVNFILCYGEFLKKTLVQLFFFLSGNDARSTTCPSACSLPADKLHPSPCLKCHGQWSGEIKEEGHRENKDIRQKVREVRATLHIEGS